MYYLLKWMKFSVKKLNIKKILENENKMLEKLGNFVSPEKLEPCPVGCVPPPFLVPDADPPPRGRPPGGRPPDVYLLLL